MKYNYTGWRQNDFITSGATQRHGLPPPVPRHHHRHEVAQLKVVLAGSLQGAPHARVDAHGGIAYSVFFQKYYNTYAPAQAPDVHRFLTIFRGTVPYYAMAIPNLQDIL
jgi:hypothetical protein